MDNRFRDRPTGTARGRRLRALFVAVFALAGLCWAATRPAAAEPDPDKPHTVTYDVGDLILKPGPTRPGFGIEDVIKAITAASPETWQGSKEKATIAAVNDTRLEVHATAAVQAEVEGVLGSLRRRADVTVDVDCKVYEVEQKYYDKHLRTAVEKARPGPGKPFGSALEDGLGDQFRDHATLVRSNRVRLANAREGSCLSVWKAFTYIVGRGGKGKPRFDTAFHGFRVRAEAVVSPDLRFVTLKLFEDAKNLVEIEAFKEEGPGRDVEIPRLEEVSAAATFKVGDGESILVPLLFLPDAVKKKDRVWVLVVEPLIHIEEEERARTKKGS
jgi:hypothetical protein